MKIRSLLFLTLLTVFRILPADPPKYSNDFMYIGVGAHNFGVGNAVVASTSDVTAGYWNPAGLVRIPNNIQFSFMHNEYFASIAKYDYAGIAFPLDSNKHAFALNFLRFGVDDIPNTLELIEPDGTVNYDNVKSFSVGDYGILLSYANNIIPNLALGATAKIVHHKAGSFARSWGFGVDIGAIYTLRDWRFGFTVKDITTTFNAWSFSFTEKEKQALQLTGNEIPQSSLEITLPRIQFGVSYSKQLGKKTELSAEIDWEMTTDGKRNTLIATNAISMDPRIGIEAGFFQVFYLRGGISNFQRLTNTQGEKTFTVQPNLGVGLRFRSIMVDYAYTDVGKASNNQFSHVVSVRVGINKRKPRQEELISSPNSFPTPAGEPENTPETP